MIIKIYFPPATLLKQFNLINWFSIAIRVHLALLKVSSMAKQLLARILLSRNPLVDLTTKVRLLTSLEITLIKAMSTPTIKPKVLILNNSNSSMRHIALTKMTIITTAALITATNKTTLARLTLKTRK